MLSLSDITIDAELESLLPPLSPEENAELIMSIGKDGFTDPVIVWLGHNILVDGHNRLRIWKEQSESLAPPRIIEMEFQHRGEVKEFALRRQMARRNLTDAARVQLALRLKDLFAAKAKANQSLGRGAKAEAARTDESIGKAAGVSRDTVRKVADVLDRGSEFVKKEMLNGGISIHRAFSTIRPTDKSTSVGMSVAHKAISILSGIPLDDNERQRAFTKVSQWLFDNQ
jgi:ParB-like chromosome segregation protein Spo0J